MQTPGLCRAARCSEECRVTHSLILGSPQGLEVCRGCSGLGLEGMVWDGQPPWEARTLLQGVIGWGGHDWGW